MTKENKHIDCKMFSYVKKILNFLKIKKYRFANKVTIN
nr:MAG TPA: hypothetical protein [Caudoviricetes sp.]